eukprot:CAMPEP_0172822860 /NCGR_PEP_ID=MMETSP1075-20121228/16930_1 /TAXON_ID=2916 /ORGANISM="Ceratium fusus, Strain PA161109" /LENGTH=39 /DNA_ID= /DNA_START= /DNA_END= /DNA_ORIENTATION=
MPSNRPVNTTPEEIVMEASDTGCCRLGAIPVPHALEAET